MLGTIGEEHRIEGAVISSTVTLASWAEQLTKLYRSSIIITEDTFHLLNNPIRYSFRVIDRVIVKGRKEPSTLWEVFDGDDPIIKDAKRLTAKSFEEGVSLYYMREFEEAGSQFQKCLETLPNDRAAQIFLKRCQHYSKIGWDEPWEGVTYFENKFKTPREFLTT